MSPQPLVYDMTKLLLDRYKPDHRIDQLIEQDLLSIQPKDEVFSASHRSSCLGKLMLHHPFATLLSTHTNPSSLLLFPPPLPSILFLSLCRILPLTLPSPSLPFSHHLYLPPLPFSLPSLFPFPPLPLILSGFSLPFPAFPSPFPVLSPLPSPFFPLSLPRSFPSHSHLCTKLILW